MTKSGKVDKWEKYIEDVCVKYLDKVDPTEKDNLDQFSTELKKVVKQIYDEGGCIYHTTGQAITDYNEVEAVVRYREGQIHVFVVPTRAWIKKNEEA